RPGITLERVENAFEQELARIGREPVTDDELTRAKALLETEELGALGRVEERADRLAMYATLFDDPDLINQQLARYLAVTQEGIRDASAAVFQPDNRVVLTYVPDTPPADEATNPDELPEDEEIAA